MAQGFLLFFLCGPLSHIHLRINICKRVKVITSTNTRYHRSAKAHIPVKFQLYSSFKTQLRNDCTKNGSRVLTFPYASNNNQTPPCNCSNKPTCPLGRKCRNKSITYKATINTWGEKKRLHRSQQHRIHISVL